MTDRAEFDRLVKDALTNLHNYAALETHPLISYFTPSSDQQISRGEFLRHLLLQTIDKLQPPEEMPPTIPVEWRPYLILKGRYIEGFSLDELKGQLMLSGRQLRREHGRALAAVANLLWDQVSPEQITSDVETKDIDEPEWNKDFRAFEINQETLDLIEIVKGIAGIFAQRAKTEAVDLNLDLAEELPPILADRIILRQIMLGLFSYALSIQSGQFITVGTGVKEDQPAFWIQAQVDENEPLTAEAEDDASSLEFAQYWSQRLSTGLEIISPVDHQASKMEIILSLPRPGQAVALVVDDQQTAIRMFRRYLRQTSLKVMGVKDPSQVVPLARELQPQVITLDVMMPTIDGWEILQTLQADPKTEHIPVIVCSVWDEPELAFSLGAANFLKKPVTQKQLLDALAQLPLPE
jgi:CheY-like chemotaxis protein